MIPAGPPPVTAAGGVVFRERDGRQEILLMFRRGHWDLPKGKAEAGEDVAACAVREVEEETGLRGVRIVGPLGTTGHTYTDAWGHWHKTTHWFRMEAEGAQTLVPQAEEDITALEWVALEEARTRVTFDTLRLVLDRLGN